MKHALSLLGKLAFLTLAGCGADDQATPRPDPVAMQNPVGFGQLDEALRVDASQGPRAGVAPHKRSAHATPADGALAIDIADREAVRVFYNGLFLKPEPPIEWSGSYATLAAGNVSANYRAATVERINWFRAMAGVPANVTQSDSYALKAQQAAMMMSLNGMLSHFPTASWKGYSAAGAEGAANSNLALGNAGIKAIDQYIADYGANNGPVGHRRWILYPQTRSFGVGSVPGQQSAAPYIYPANALWVFDGNYGAPRPAVRDEFVAWPPPGYVPHTVVYSRWSLSYPGANFSKASVSLTRLGKSVATTIEPVLDGSGENTIVWQLDGVAPNSSLPKPTADDTYTVTVANVSIGGAARAFTYAVTVFDPAVPTPGAAQTSVSVPAEVALAAKFQLAVVPMNNATQYSVLRFRRQALAGKRFNTSNAAGDWSSGSGIALDATAGPTFRLSNQSNAREQAIVLNKQLLVGSTGRVSLTRSMLLATTQEQFHLQLSSDGGATWNDVYSERGIAQLGPTSRIQADLSAFAGRPVQFRMLLSPGASYYVCSGCGWALSDIDFEGVDELLDEQGFTVPAASARLETSIQKPGSYVLFGRTQYQSRYDSAFGKGAYLEVTGVLLTGKRSNYTIITTTDGVVITDNVGGDGVQRVRNPFRLDFTDVTVAYDLSGNAGRAYRLYRAALNRPPDAGGLGFWIKALDNGATLDQMAAGFTSSSEFKLLYGASPTHAQLIEAAYNNVLHRVPDAAGAAYWVGALAGSLSTEAMLAYFSESAENQQQVAAAIASGIEYVRY